MTFGFMQRAFRLFRWTSLAVCSIVIVLILIPSPQPDVEASTKSAEQVGTKIRKFSASLRKGQALPLEMNQEELNSWLSTNLSFQRTEPDAEEFPVKEDTQGAVPQNAVAASQVSESAEEEVRSSIKDVKIELLDDSLRAYAAFDFHGKELTLVLEGTLSAQDGYLRFEPTSGQLGSLPLPAMALKNATQKLFEDPKNRESFRLPPQIQGIHVLNGSLLIIPQ